MNNSEKKDCLTIQRMFRQACVFADISLYCERESIVHTLPLDTYSVPGIVNTAFSCEVFIKLLLNIDEIELKRIKIHNLNELWEMYKKKDETAVLQIEQAIMRNYKNSNLELFREKLNIVSNSFDEWRYIYEKDCIKSDRIFIGLLRDALREHCCLAVHKKTWADFIREGYKWYS